MIRAVLGANVLASGPRFRKGRQAAILDLWTERAFEMILSRRLLQEIENRLANDVFVGRFGPNVESNIYLAIKRAPITDLMNPVFGAATHPEDDLILATAVSGGADSLVNGDKQLLKLGSFEGVRIVDSRAFLEILNQQKADVGKQERSTRHQRRPGVGVRISGAPESRTSTSISIEAPDQPGMKTPGSMQSAMPARSSVRSPAWM